MGRHSTDPPHPVRTRSAPGTDRSGTVGRTMRRQCARPGCAEQATSTFGFDYAGQIVWLVDLTEDDHPSTYDLCRRHAATLSVPHGWHLRDARAGLGAPPAPSDVLAREAS
jgi:hypothetical protein